MGRGGIGACKAAERGTMPWKSRAYRSSKLNFLHTCIVVSKTMILVQNRVGAVGLAAMKVTWVYTYVSRRTHYLLFYFLVRADKTTPQNKIKKSGPKRWHRRIGLHLDPVVHAIRRDWFCKCAVSCSQKTECLCWLCKLLQLKFAVKRYAFSNSTN
jgi:hypothetical protein